MDERDHFAAAVFGALIAAGLPADPDDAARLASDAYDLADTLLHERARRAAERTARDRENVEGPGCTTCGRRTVHIAHLKRGVFAMKLAPLTPAAMREWHRVRADWRASAALDRVMCPSCFGLHRLDGDWAQLPIPLPPESPAPDRSPASRPYFRAAIAQD